MLHHGNIRNVIARSNSISVEYDRARILIIDPHLTEGKKKSASLGKVKTTIVSERSIIGV